MGIAIHTPGTGPVIAGGDEGGLAEELADEGGPDASGAVDEAVDVAEVD
jgi:hypothetical protein